MYREDYDRKMMELLEDRRTYESVPRDPTSGYQTTNNDLVKDLVKVKAIDLSQAKLLTTYNASCPRIYGTPKAHKSNLPLRPVVPCMTSPSYELSKFIGKILQPSIEGKYNVKDSFSFCASINSVVLPPGYILISLDVTSLFTNIPRSLVRHIITNKWDSIKTFTKIELNLFIKITMFCMESSYFMYGGKFYKQIFGTAMGNPLSPTFADFVMEELMHHAISRLNFVPPVVAKYVDDLLLAIPSTELQHVLDVFNGYEPHIQFTHELEVDGRIPFLDMTLVRKSDQSIRTEWYMKPIASGRFMDYTSFHPLHQKINMIKSFARRVTLLSTNLPRDNINNIIDEQLRVNHYPRNLRHRIINRTTERSPHGITQPSSIGEEDGDQATPRTQYRSLPYVPALSDKIRQILKRDYSEVTIALQTTNSVRDLFTRVKDKVPKENQHNVIYSIPCSGCSASYVGMTTQLLKNRISGHRSNINALSKLSGSTSSSRTNKIDSLRAKTALVNHMVEAGHQFALDEVKILDRHKYESGLAYLEACHITNNETINKRTDTDNLNATYAGILQTLKQKMLFVTPNTVNTNTNT